MSDDQRLEETRAFWRDVGQGMVRESVPAVNGAVNQVSGIAHVSLASYLF